MGNKEQQTIFLIVLLFAFVIVILYPGWHCAKQKELIEIAPAVNPLTAELEEANRMIDSLVSFNNLLIRELEECENEEVTP